MKIPGLIIAPLTPFAEDLTLDVGRLKRGVDYVVDDCDAAIVIAAGVEAQEYQCFDLEGRKRLLGHTISAVGGRRPVAAGVSHPSFKVAIELARFAADEGASAIQVLAPLRPAGGPPAPDDVLRYFEAIAAETDLPIVAYLNAGPGADLSAEATIALSRIAKVQYLKESSRDMTRVSRLIVEIEDAGHARYFTTMQMLLPTLMLGGSGVTLPPPAARLARLVIDAFVQGEWAEAARLQKQFALWPARWMGYGLTAVMKASMEILGLPMGDPYPPFSPLPAEAKAQLATYLKTTAIGGSSI